MSEDVTPRGEGDTHSEKGDVEEIALPEEAVRSMYTEASSSTTTFLAAPTLSTEDGAAAFIGDAPAAAEAPSGEERRKNRRSKEVSRISFSFGGGGERPGSRDRPGSRESEPGGKGIIASVMSGRRPSVADMTGGLIGGSRKGSKVVPAPPALFNSSLEASVGAPVDDRARELATQERLREEATARRRANQSAAEARAAWEERTLMFLAQGGARTADGTPVSRWIKLQNALRLAVAHGKRLDDSERMLFRGSSTRAIQAATHTAKEAEAAALREIDRRQEAKNHERMSVADMLHAPDTPFERGDCLFF